LKRATFYGLNNLVKRANFAKERHDKNLTHQM
jgi:hypothetical protein